MEEKDIRLLLVEDDKIDQMAFERFVEKEKLSYETNNSGKVTEINYDSRLLAFSIPTKGQLKE